MAEKKYGSFESVYQGSYSPLNPNYGSLFTGYRVPVSQISLTTDPRTANVISEVTSKLSHGQKQIELSLVSPEVFESIPKDHLKEVNRLGKLTGMEFSLHAPVIDPAGFSREGWSESERENNERQFKAVVVRAHDLNPKGNVPVTFHATTGIYSTLTPKPKGVEPTEEDVVYVVNRETGQIAGIRRERKYNPEEKKEVWLEPEEQLKEANKKMWDRNFSSIAWEEVKAGNMIGESAPIVQPFLQALENKEITEDDLLPEQRQALNQMKMGQVIYDDVGSHVKAFYNDAMRLWPKEVKEKNVEELKKIRNQIFEIEQKNLMEKNPAEAAQRYDDALKRFRKIVKESPPQFYVPTTDFALEKSKETLANTALFAYKKFGKSAPIISVENVFPNTVFATGSELASLVKESRETFVKKAKATGMGESEAREAASKLIGATWDTGHINMIRKYGFGEDEEGKFNPKKFEKFMVEETKKIAPFVKHVHISDNFGFEHTELPPGMGEVPLKGMLTEIEKAGYKGPKVIEAGNWWQHFKTSPIPPAFEAFGSPIYGMQMQPYWNQAAAIYGMPGPYSGGYGMMLPEQHFSTYGSGFSTLPSELGGTMPGKGQKFSGTPME